MTDLPTNSHYEEDEINLLDILVTLAESWKLLVFGPMLAGVLAVIAPLDRWTEKEQTQAEVETFILDQVYLSLPEPPYTPDDKAEVAQLVYRHIWQQSLRGQDHEKR